MRVLVNNEEMTFDADESAEVQIAHLMAALQEKNLVVMETRVNDVKTAEDLTDLVKLNEVEEVALIVGTPRQVVEEGLESAISYLPVLREGLSEIAGLFQEGREGEGIARFLEAHSGLEWLSQILNGASAYLPGDIERDSFRKAEDSYRQKLTELTLAWENRDYVLIADLLEYEVGPFIEELLPLITGTSGEKSKVE